MKQEEPIDVRKYTSAPDESNEISAAEPGPGTYFGDVVRARLARRSFLQGVGMGVGLVALPAVLSPSSAAAHSRDPGRALRFVPIAPSGLDRPEDVEVSPVTKKVYIALTNNSARTTTAADPGEVAANPRLGNRWGHVVEIEEDGGDNAASSFRWEIFLICGDPSTTPGVYFAGFDPSLVSPISCPDNLDFDARGNLWIATDGAPASPGFAAWNDGIFAVPTEGPERGYLRQFLSGVAGCEVASLKHSADSRTLFATIQHPGEGRGLPNPQSSWPDGTNLPPRPSVIAVRHSRGREIGS